MADILDSKNRQLEICFMQIRKSFSYTMVHFREAERQQQHFSSY